MPSWALQKWQKFLTICFFTLLYKKGIQENRKRPIKTTPHLSWVWYFLNSKTGDFQEIDLFDLISKMDLSVPKVICNDFVVCKLIRYSQLTKSWGIPKLIHRNISKSRLFIYRQCSVEILATVQLEPLLYISDISYHSPRT